MTRPLVAVSDSVFPTLDLAEGVLSELDAELRLADEPTPEAILDVARDADGMLVTYAQITSDMIRQLNRCRVIARFGIGVDNVDIEAATQANIVVTKVPDYCIDEVSDHSLGLLLALARKIPFSNQMTHAGEWKMPAVAPLYRLKGCVLGLVGFGQIPRLLAPKAQALGLKVIVIRPGAFDTDMVDSTDAQMQRMVDKTALYKMGTKNFQRVMHSQTGSAKDPKELAKIYFKAVMNKRPKLSYTKDASLMIGLYSAMPTRLRALAIRRILRSK